MELTMWRKLADGEHPYDEGPFAADHIKLFRDDAREVLAEIERLREVERTARAYVDAVDRGRELSIGNLGMPVLQFQRMRTALGGYPTLADPTPVESRR